MTATHAEQIASCFPTTARESAPLVPVMRTDPSMNALKLGFTSEALLLPNESREEYEGTLTAWLETLRPANAAEGRLVARIADIDFRMQRLNRVEKQQILAAVEEQVAASGTALQASELRAAIAAVGSMARVTDETSPSACPEGVSALRPAIRTLAEQLISFHLPGDGTGVVYRAWKVLEEQGATGREADAAWKSLGEGARAVEGDLAGRLADLEKELAQERDELLEQRVIGDDREAKKLQRYRAALQRELDQVLATLRTTREMASQVTNPPEGSFCKPFRVDLRVLLPRGDAEAGADAVVVQS